MANNRNNEVNIEYNQARSNFLAVVAHENFIWNMANVTNLNLLVRPPSKFL